MVESVGCGGGVDCRDLEKAAAAAEEEEIKGGGGAATPTYIPAAQLRRQGFNLPSSAGCLPHTLRDARAERSAGDRPPERRRGAQRRRAAPSFAKTMAGLTTVASPLEASLAAGVALYRAVPAQTTNTMNQFKNKKNE